MVQKAFELGWIDLVVLVECENGKRDPFAVWDWGDAHWLCQMNTNYHKIPQEYYDDWWFQIEYCNQKMQWGTKFYWPSRLIKWVKCSEYVLDRFTITW